MCGNRAGIYDCLISDLSPETLRRMRICTSPSCRVSLFCFEFWPSHLSKQSVKTYIELANIRNVSLTAEMSLHWDRRNVLPSHRGKRPVWQLSILREVASIPNAAQVWSKFASGFQIYSYRCRNRTYPWISASIRSPSEIDAAARSMSCSSFNVFSGPSKFLTRAGWVLR